MPIRNLAIAVIVLLSAAPSFPVPQQCNTDHPDGVIYVKTDTQSVKTLIDLSSFRNERTGLLETPRAILEQKIPAARVIKVGSEWLDKHLHAAIYFCLN